MVWGRKGSAVPTPPAPCYVLGYIWEAGSVRLAPRAAPGPSAGQQGRESRALGLRSYLGSLRALARSCLPFPSLLLLQELSRQACVKHTWLFSELEPAPTPRSAQALINIKSWQADTPAAAPCSMCVNTGIDKIMEAGIKKTMDLGCSPALTSGSGGRTLGIPWQAVGTG